MRKIILGVAVSLDGYIEGPNGEYDWCPPPSTTEMNSFLNRVDTVFFGRKSYELAGTSMFPGKECFVFSNTLKSVKGKDIYLVNGDVVKKVNELKIQKGKDMWLFGGATLTTTFMNAGLVDELWLGVVPVVLGAGKPLFQNIEQRKYFSVQKVTQLNGYLSLKLTRTETPVKKGRKRN
ncbi:dihydrofolate reductase family protein [Oscillatoria amoena NRMC-F 0135]|nr:dihydrofolate reductase family protein [Oscillatoria amoena NRMC-F 0135]